MKSYGEIRFKQDVDEDGIPDQINLLLPPQAGNSDKVLVTRNGKLVWESLNSNLLAKAGLGQINVNNPVLGDVLYYNGYEWTTESLPTTIPSFGYWSGSIPAKSGTTIVSEKVIPTISVGTSLMTQVVTPLSADSKFTISFAAPVMAPVNGSNCVVFLLRRVQNGSGVWGDWNFIGWTASSSSIFSDSMASAAFILTDSPNTNKPVEYTIRIGASRGSWYINRGTDTYTSESLNSGWTIREF